MDPTGYDAKRYSDECPPYEYHGCIHTGWLHGSFGDVLYTYMDPMSYDFMGIQGYPNHWFPLIRP